MKKEEVKIEFSLPLADKAKLVKYATLLSVPVETALRVIVLSVINLDYEDYFDAFDEEDDEDLMSLLANS